MMKLGKTILKHVLGVNKLNLHQSIRATCQTVLIIQWFTHSVHYSWLPENTVTPVTI